MEISLNSRWPGSERPWARTLDSRGFSRAQCHIISVTSASASGVLPFDEPFYYCFESLGAKGLLDSPVILSRLPLELVAHVNNVQPTCVDSAAHMINLQRSPNHVMLAGGAHNWLWGRRGDTVMLNLS